MTPAARVQAAIDLLDAVIAAAARGGASADRVAADWFRPRRFVGSKDRRAIRDLAWDAIRACGAMPPSGRAALLRLAEADPALVPLFDGSTYGPAPIGPEDVAAPGGVASAWLCAQLAASGINPAGQAALLARAPLDIRVNTLRIAPADFAAQCPVPPEAVPGAPEALRFAPGTPVEAWPQHADGLFEVQDAGSQMVASLSGASPGRTVVDLCAGGGGKTLMLAAMMAGRGRLIACDIDRARLSRLPARAARAGAAVECRLLDGGREAEALADLRGKADLVLVDAPCSGTGTWRRNPEARWRIDAAAIARYARMQAQVLDLAVPLVARGGRITFITWSLLDAEGADAVAAFLARHPGWHAEPIAHPCGQARGQGHRFTPGQDGTDGFFVANLASGC